MSTADTQTAELDFQIADNWKLTVENESLKEQNAQLRQQLADVTESMGRVEERCAKLRERCRDLYILRFVRQMEWKLSMETYEKYDPCDLCQKEHGGKSPCASTAEDMSEECCNPYQAAIVAEKLRELGVEVPE